MAESLLDIFEDFAGAFLSRSRCGQEGDGEK